MCGGSEENLLHFLTECLVYTSLRLKYFGSYFIHGSDVTELYTVIITVMYPVLFLKFFRF